MYRSCCTSVCDSTMCDSSPGNRKVYVSFCGAVRGLHYSFRRISSDIPFAPPLSFLVASIWLFSVLSASMSLPLGSTLKIPLASFHLCKLSHVE